MGLTSWPSLCFPQAPAWPVFEPCSGCCQACLTGSLWLQLCASMYPNNRADIVPCARKWSGYRLIRRVSTRKGKTKEPQRDLSRELHYSNYLSFSLPRGLLCPPSVTCFFFPSSVATINLCERLAKGGIACPLPQR